MTEQAATPAVELDIERDGLKERAKELGLTFSNNIGTDTLRARVEEAEAAKFSAAAPAVVEEETPALIVEPKETESQMRMRLIKEARKLIRVQIENLDPRDADLEGDWFTAGNEYVGNIKKYVPFGEVTFDGWHLEQILVDMLVEKEYQHIKTFKDRLTGHQRVETSTRRKFKVTVLPPLTQEEVNLLAASQVGMGD